MSTSAETASAAERAEGHYWVRWLASGNWDVLYWRDGIFWDHCDGGFRPENFVVGPQIFPPSVH